MQDKLEGITHQLLFVLVVIYFSHEELGDQTFNFQVHIAPVPFELLFTSPYTSTRLFGKF